VIVENEGESTVQSTTIAIEIMYRMRLRTVIVVSDGYHIYRVKKMLEARGFKAYGSPRKENNPGPVHERWNYVKQAIGYLLWRAGCPFNSSAEVERVPQILQLSIEVERSGLPSSELEALQEFEFLFSCVAAEGGVFEKIFEAGQSFERHFGALAGAAAYAGVLQAAGASHGVGTRHGRRTASALVLRWPGPESTAPWHSVWIRR